MNPVVKKAAKKTSVKTSVGVPVGTSSASAPTPAWRAPHVAFLAKALARAEAGVPTLTAPSVAPSAARSSNHEPADLLLRRFFRENANLGQKDRALIAEGVFAYLRRRRSILAVTQSTKPERLAMTTFARDQNVPVSDLLCWTKNEKDRAWVSTLPERLAFPLSDVENADVPDDLWAFLNAQFSPDEVTALTAAWQKSAAFDLRVNTMKTSRDDALAALRADGFDVTKTPYSPFGVRVAGRVSLAHHAWLADGRLEVQSESSQLVGQLLAPKRGEMIADFCAGAGGKTLLIGMLMRSTGRLYAFDVSETRLQKLSPRLKRSGLSNVFPQRIAHENDAKLKRLAGKIDRVLVDAPCSGSGTFSRNPDLKWRFSRAALAELTAKQAAILSSSSRLVKSGGRLVYATCSVLREENEAIVEAFLREHPSFSLVSAGDSDILKLYPHIHHTDGFFAAVMVRG